METETDTKTQIAEQKALIKELVEEQVADKKLLRQPHHTVPHVRSIQSRAFYRRHTITRALIKYHCLRETKDGGSSHMG